MYWIYTANNLGNICQFDIYSGWIHHANSWGDECKLGSFCSPFGRRVGEYIYFKIYICVGYLLQTILGEYVSWIYIKDGDIAPWKDLNKDKRKEQRYDYILIWGGSSSVSIFFTSAFVPLALRLCVCRICEVSWHSLDFYWLSTNFYLLSMDFYWLPTDFYRLSTDVYWLSTESLLTFTDSVWLLLTLYWPLLTFTDFYGLSTYFYWLSTDFYWPFTDCQIQSGTFEHSLEQPNLYVGWDGMGLAGSWNWLTTRAPLGGANK